MDVAASDAKKSGVHTALPRQCLRSQLRLWSCQ